MAYRFSHPMKFTGTYPSNWAGYTWLALLGYTSGNHPGVDYNWGAGNQDLGMDMYAIADGTISYVGDQTAKGFGKTTIIEHVLDPRLAKKYGTAKVYSRYMHQQHFVTGLKTGSKVKCGQKIGTVGNTGTHWSHAHVEIWRGALGSHLEYHKNPAYIKANYFDTFRFIEANKNNVEEDMYQGKTAKQWFETALSYNKRIKALEASVAKYRGAWQTEAKLRTELTTALANEKAKPPVEVIKEVEKIVEKIVEVPAEVDEQAVIQNWFQRLLGRFFRKE